MVERGGPRTIHKDNSHPKMKIKLRAWLVEKIKPESILDVYGGHGMMFEKVWHKFKYETTTGDSLKWLEAQSQLDYSIYDVDPYSSPYEALHIIDQKSRVNRIGICCTDGMLRRQAGMRGHISTFVNNLCGWSGRDMSLMAAIYHQYPSYLRFVLSKAMSSYEIESLAVMYGKRRSQATVYFAAVLNR